MTWVAGLTFIVGLMVGLGCGIVEVQRTIARYKAAQDAERELILDAMFDTIEDTKLLERVAARIKHGPHKTRTT